MVPPVSSFCNSAPGLFDLCFRLILCFSQDVCNLVKVELAAEKKLQSDLNNKGINENLIMKIIGLYWTTREKVYSDLRIDQIN